MLYGGEPNRLSAHVQAVKLYLHGFLSIDFFNNCSGKKLKGLFLGLDEQQLLVSLLGFSFCE
jgi:hypothetical protein